MVQRKIIEEIRNIKGKAGVNMKFVRGDKVDFIFTNADGIYVKTGTVVMEKKGGFFREPQYLIESSFECRSKKDSWGVVWVESKEGCVWIKESKIIGLSISKDR